MRVLALDIGDVRVGLAISDADGQIAQPLCILSRAEVEQNSKPFLRVLQDWEPDMLLCGLPITLQGEEGVQAQSVRALAQKVANNVQLPLEFMDERLSSREAKQLLRRQGLNEKQMRGRVDALAASIFLQTWLDARANAEEL